MLRYHPNISRPVYPTLTGNPPSVAGFLFYNYQVSLYIKDDDNITRSCFPVSADLPLSHLHYPVFDRIQNEAHPGLYTKFRK